MLFLPVRGVALSGVQQRPRPRQGVACHADQRRSRRLCRRGRTHREGREPALPHHPLSVLANAASTANTLIDTFLWVYILLIFVYVLTSWVRLPYTVWVRRISDFLRDVCEPYLRVFRRILPPLGPLDLSPVVAMLALIALMRIVDALFAHYT